MWVITTHSDAEACLEQKCIYCLSLARFQNEITSKGIELLLCCRVYVLHLVKYTSGTLKVKYSIAVTSE